MSLLGTRMQIPLPAEKTLHTNFRKLSACFVFILLVPSFPKHLQVACHSVLQLDPIQHLCSSPVNRRVSPWPKVLGGVPLLTASSRKQMGYSPLLSHFHPGDLNSSQPWEKPPILLLNILISGWSRQKWSLI